MRCNRTLKSGATLCIPISSTIILWMKPCLYGFLLCTRFPYNHNHKWDLSETLPLSDTGFWGHWSDPILSAPGIVAVHTTSTRKTLSALDEGRRHACSLPECVREGEGRREREEGRRRGGRRCHWGSWQVPPLRRENSNQIECVLASTSKNSQELSQPNSKSN